MLFNFILNQRTFLALARGEAAPILQALAETPDAARRRASGPRSCATTTRSTSAGSSVTSTTRCFAAFGPEPDMQLYGRGIRRRLAPMLGNDRRRIELAYALQFSLPGTPVLRYGEEIGMGEDLSLPERDAIRTPMQWSRERQRRLLHDAERKRDLRRPGHHRRRVRLSSTSTSTPSGATPASLLSLVRAVLRTLRECPEFGIGTLHATSTPATAAVLALRPRGARPARCWPCTTSARRSARSTSARSPRPDGRPHRGVRRPRLRPTVGPTLDGHRRRRLRLPLDPPAPHHRRTSRVRSARRSDAAVSGRRRR